MLYGLLQVLQARRLCVIIKFTTTSDHSTDNHDRSSTTPESSQIQDLNSTRLTSRWYSSNLTKSTDRSKATSTRCRETDPSTASWCIQSRQKPTSRNSSTA
jgi:hypothetical protein